MIGSSIFVALEAGFSPQLWAGGRRPVVDPRRRNSSGFTLVESILIVLLIGFLAFVVIPKFNAYYTIELRSAVKELASDIRYAQSQAIATREHHGLVFDPADERYFVYVGDTSTPAMDFFDPTQPLRRNLVGVDIVSAAFNGASSLEFDALGVPYDGSGAELSTAGLVVLGESGILDTVKVLPLTGEVEF